jgi:hypothetical protein
MTTLGHCPTFPRPCLGDAIVGARLDESARRAGNADLAWGPGQTCEPFRNVVAALAVAVRRLQTDGKVKAHYCETFAYAPTAALVVRRVGRASAVIINRLVDGLGVDHARPEVTSGPREPTMPELAPGEQQHLPSDLRAMAPEQARWPAFRLSAWRRATLDNAAWGHGRRLDIEQNQGPCQLLDRPRG